MRESTKTGFATAIVIDLGDHSTLFAATRGHSDQPAAIPRTRSLIHPLPASPMIARPTGERP